MDTNRIKNVALGARTALMASTGIALDRVLAPDSPERLVYPNVISQLESIVFTDRDGLVERVAYTWFNRLCALRYMDVRGYTPIGIVSPRDGEAMPAILTDARKGIYAPGLDFPQGVRDMVAKVLSGEVQTNDPLGKAYVILLTAACAMYEKSMGYLFGPGRDTAGATELLAPTDLLSEGSLLQKICTGLDEGTCKEGVEVMGWLYQFYVSERKDAFFKSRRKATAADIAPATQLFTPNWIVRYLVENSLGRLWMLNFPESELKEHMDYYVEPEESEDDFLEIYSPEDITFLDPACGSGHILVYAFDLLYLMYEEEGYRPSVIPELILKNNLTGIEIDDRAAEIASFCLEMRALEYDTDFLTKDVDARILVAHKGCFSADEQRLVPNIWSHVGLKKALEQFDEIGSLLLAGSEEVAILEDAVSSLSNMNTFDTIRTRNTLDDLLSVITAIATPYAVVATNPPYMKTKGMSTELNQFIRKNYMEEKGDLCTCFIRKSIDMLLPGGYAALVTMQSWMTQGTYSSFRKKILSTSSICSMAHLGAHAFEALGGEIVQTTAAVYTNRRVANSVFIRVTDESNANDKKRVLLDAIGRDVHPQKYFVDASSFSSVPDYIIAYDLSESMRRCFTDFPGLGTIAEGSVGLQTGDNDRFVRMWWETSISRIGFGCKSIDESIRCGRKWFPHNKGGEYRKWYGNDFNTVNWMNNGESVRMLGPNEKRHVQDYRDDFKFAPVVTWSKIAGKSFAFRYKPYGFLSDIVGLGVYPKQDTFGILGFLNSSVGSSFLRAVSPTITTAVGEVKKVPISPEVGDSRTCELVRSCIDISREDWDAFEISWNFVRSPLIHGTTHTEQPLLLASRIEDCYEIWSGECASRFRLLKSNEEELNRIFTAIYHMEGEVPIEVQDDRVSVRSANIGRDIRNLISYGVGCMFGRYSLDEPGLILADECSTLDDYHEKVSSPTFEPDHTGIIPITEFDDAIFDDDIVSQFRRWLAAAFGETTLDDNVAFIEKALKKSLRTYFARDFYNDHVKTYQKRPIYWLFSSPKRGFQALVYLHRYTPQTVSTLLAEYVRPMRDNLGTQARLKEVTGRAKDVSLAAKYDSTVAELDEWEHDVIFPLAQKHVSLNLDDGVKANYGKPEFKGALRKVTGLN